MYELDTSLMNQLPDWFAQILDFQEVMNAEQPSFDALADEIIAVADNFFFQTMDSSAIAQWEGIFNIVANPSTETMDFRRDRVLNRISTKPPFTLAFLYQKLDELIGPNQWTVNVDYPNYTLYIESSAQNQSYATEVAFTINRIKPAHIVYVNSPYTQSALWMSEEIDLTQRVYNYKLGAWGLGLLPFATENLMGVIKTPEMPSIQSALLNDVASFTSRDIASVKLNGTIDITSLTKQVTGNVCEVSYSVTPAQAETITQAQLLKADGTVLAQSTIFVPVDQGTVIKHKILVQEGVTTSGD
mgnify:FL=1